MFIINQHHNLSHPKLLVVPRGLPIKDSKTLYKILHKRKSKNIKKKYLLLTASSNWGKRPEIVQCVSKNIPFSEFFGHSDTLKTPDYLSEKEVMVKHRQFYYENLISARFGLSLPGLGYDCFRTWELLSLGRIVFRK